MAPQAAGQKGDGPEKRRRRVDENGFVQSNCLRPERIEQHIHRDTFSNPRQPAQKDASE